jgi:peptidoglycan/xylan/chitin deacetylase (PgdA/CDA1 family)
LTFDFDALSIWMSTFKQTTPSPLSRGEYGARVGISRILALLASHGVHGTFFVPAHTALSFPDAVREIIAAGHEIGAHGYLHELTAGLSRTEEDNLLKRSLETLQRAIGKNQRPVGYRSPAWDLSENTIELLEKHEFIYDSSLMADDFRPFRPRRNDQLSETGFIRGPESNLIEFPVAWELDDFPYFHFATRPINPGLRNPKDVLELWRGEFDYCQSEVPDGVFTLTMHPEIIGRGPRIHMLDLLIRHMKSMPHVRFSTLAEEACRRRVIEPGKPQALGQPTAS